MAERRDEPTFGRKGAPPTLAAEAPPAEPPPWRGEERGGRYWWLVLVLLILAGLAWYLWDKGHLAQLEAAILGSPTPLPAPAPGGLSAAEAGELEALLAALALDPGPVDGTLDAATATAIAEFQAMAGLPADGKPSATLLEELRAVARQMGIEVRPGG